MGLARDGHLVYGPYNGKQELWSCSEHDVCNGAFLEDGSYAYVSTSSPPYVVSCWGPASDPSSCPENNCVGPFSNIDTAATFVIITIVLLILIGCCISITFHIPPCIGVTVLLCCCKKTNELSTVVPESTPNQSSEF